MRRLKKELRDKKNGSKEEDVTGEAFLQNQELPPSKLICATYIFCLLPPPLSYYSALIPFSQLFELKFSASHFYHSPPPPFFSFVNVPLLHSGGTQIGGASLSRGAAGKVQTKVGW